MEPDDIGDGETSRSVMDSAWQSFTNGSAEHSLNGKGFVYDGWVLAMLRVGGAEGEANHLIHTWGTGQLFYPANLATSLGPSIILHVLLSCVHWLSFRCGFTSKINF